MHEFSRRNSNYRHYKLNSDSQSLAAGQAPAGDDSECAPDDSTGDPGDNGDTDATAADAADATADGADGAAGPDDTDASAAD